MSEAKLFTACGVLHETIGKKDMNHERYCRGWGAVSREQLKGIYLPKDPMVPVRETISFGVEEDGAVSRWY